MEEWPFKKINSFYLSLTFEFCVGAFLPKKGEQAFRKWFSRICEIRSLVKGVPLVALTATASKKNQRKNY